MAKGAKSLAYKELLNGLEERQPGAKHQFLVGFLKQGRAAISPTSFDQATDLRECAHCGQPTTGQICSYCRLADRGRQKVGELASRYQGMDGRAARPDAPDHAEPS